MHRVCSESGLPFAIEPEDLAFYDRQNVPPPILCPEERQRLRLAWRNERTLYKRKCSGSGRSIVAIYPTDTPFPVFDHPYFFSDNWDPTSFEREIDFSRPFFEQFKELQAVVPRILNYSFGNENADYGNLASWNRDCYMCFEADNNRDCLYCEYTYRCLDLVDCSYASESELCYGCSDIGKCYDLRHSINCTGCARSRFLKNCIGCSDCFGCVNLVKKQYCFLNEQLPREEYEQRLAKLNLGSRSSVNNHFESFLTFSRKFPHKYLNGVQNEEVSGDYLHQCKNAHSCFDSSALRDCKYVFNSERMSNAYDIDSYGGLEGAENVYECHSVGRGALDVCFGSNVYMDLAECFYCDSCAHGRHIFGCISLHHRNYCILNKQYSEPEYNRLRARLVEQMTATGEWGRFFPIDCSPFAYNETTAQIYHPVSKSEALERGWRWKDREDAGLVSEGLTPLRVEDRIEDSSSSITKETLVCAATKRPYRIQQREFDFYRRLGIPLPVLHPDERYQARISLRNPRKLWNRRCSHCSAPLQTSFSPDRPEEVLCETCYQKVLAE